MAAALAVSLTALTFGSVAAGALYPCLLAGVIASAWYGGGKPGAVTALLVAGAGAWLAPGQWAALLIFALSSAAVCVAFQAIRNERWMAQRDEYRLHCVLESTQDAVFSLDHELRIGYANIRAGEISGKSPAQLGGRSLRTVFPETPAAAIYRELNRAILDRAVAHFQDSSQASGVWYDFRAYPVPGGLNLFVRDISARKSAIEGRGALAKKIESERLRLDMILREMSVGVLIVSPDLKVERANQASIDLFGFRVAAGDDIRDMRAGVYRSVDGKELKTEEWPIVRTLTSGERIENAEAEYTRPDGAVLTLLISSVGLTRPDGELSGALATYTDVTSLRKAQQELRANELQLRRLFESPIIGIVSGENQRVINANDAFLRMVGYSRKEMARGDLDWEKITPPEFLAADARAIAQLTERGFGDPFEKEYIAKDGTRIPVLVGTAAQGEGNWSPWIAWILDLSARRRLEQRLREAARLESIGVLAGGIAHDFNNILTGVLGNASLALEQTPPDHPAREAIANTIVSSELAADLTRQLLAYAGKGRFIVRAEDVSALARDIAQLIRTSVPRNVELQFDLASGLPTIEADGTQIQQLLMNLAINGAEAIGQDAGTVRVVTGTRTIDRAWIASQAPHNSLEPGEYVSIEVQDTGCGMDEATRLRIFDPFFTTKFTGRGLGLAAAMGIVKSHQGSIHVQSARGKGSSFSILLPAGKATRSAEPEAPSEQPVQGNETILVVDDEEIVRSVSTRALERYGYKVLLASNGTEALNVFRNAGETVSLIVLDMTMPVMGGEETLKHLTKVAPGAKVLLTSGYDEADTLRRLSGANVSGFLQKPFTAGALAATVQRILKGSN